MRHRVAVISIALLGGVAPGGPRLAAVPPAPVADEIVLPPGFLAERIALDFDQPVGVAFSPEGRLFVWENAGVVWIVEDGAKLQPPFLDLREEVASWGGKGLKGFVCDPGFDRNGLCYVLYEVDRHHLLYHGTSQYDPDADLDELPTIGRLTRYTANGFDGHRSVDPASRRVLIGESIDTGFPIIGGHDTGSLVFGRDGSLLASCGDSSLKHPPDVGGVGAAGTAVAEGILGVEEDVGSFRCQLVDSLNGKVLRLDPATGDGLPGNPFYDPSRPRSARSRVWVSGLRNPYRFTVIPEERALRGVRGGARPQHPGTLLIGEVGWNSWESFCIARRGGENFGWPLFEGMEPQPQFQALPTANLHAPNPLFGAGSCQREFLDFQDLLVQESSGRPWWPNPCDPSQEIPDSVHRSMHVRPELDWGHEGPARVKDFDGRGRPTSPTLGDPSAPVAGRSFSGSCSIGGAWYAGASYPAEYRGSYFHADYAEGWIRNLRFRRPSVLASVHDFSPSVGAIVGMASDPIQGDLYFVLLDGGLHRVRYFPDNIPPRAVATVSSDHGPAPLHVSLDGRSSSDPEEGSLLHRWDLGDGTPLRRQAQLQHRFPSEDITLQGTIIAGVYELVPPQDRGGTGLDPEVVRDDVYPEQNATNAEQYFSYYQPPSAKGGEDWIGYEFAETREFRALIFQEGEPYGTSGGWFEDLGVEVRQGGLWRPIPDASIAPPFPGDNGVGLEVFEIDFPPVQGQAIRVRGTPGGDDQYVTVCELRVIAAPRTPMNTPARFDLRLTVVDPANASHTTEVPVWVNNTPPQVIVDRPLLVSPYAPDSSRRVQLEATVSDAEHPSSELECVWTPLLHHDHHVHPEPPIHGRTGEFLLVPHGEGPGEVLYWEVELVVRDPLGMATTVSCYLYPADDSNLNGYPDAEDIATGRSSDHDGDGIPDESQRDCNQNGIQDPFDLVLGLSVDLDGNGVPDECE